jgi:hypothetical protein
MHGIINDEIQSPSVRDKNHTYPGVIMRRMGEQQIIEGVEEGNIIINTLEKKTVGVALADSTDEKKGFCHCRHKPYNISLRSRHLNLQPIILNFLCLSIWT